MKNILLVSLLISFLTSTLSWSQELESTKRPKIGLALSGGAAHGFAHIGVLKYLEEVGIKVDYITGTSMGSVIGGLYALGFNANDIKHIASQLDWDMIMSNSIPLNEVAPIEKRFHDKTPLSILWKGNAFKLPQGLIRGQKLDLVISRVYCPAHLVNDFDAFHIPFRCVGVDIEDGSVDVFDQGYIGNAIRASMAIPTVFPPQEIDDRLYVDGGLIRNFPVQEVIEMGADYTIGVYVGGKKEKREELVSMLDILKQASSMSSILESDRQAKLADLVISPKVKDMGTFDFNEYEAFIELGYAAAQLHAEELVMLAAKLAKHASPERNQKLTYPSSIRFNKVTAVDAEPVFEKMIETELKLWENYAVTLDQIDEGLSILYGTKNFSKAAYTFDKNEEGLGLVIDVEETAPFNLGFNVNRFDLYNTAFVLSAEARNVIGKPSNLRMDLRVSDNPGIQGMYFLRLPSAPSFLVRLSSKLERFELPQYNGTNLEQFFSYYQGYVQLDFVNEWKNKFLFNAGYRFLHDELHPQVLGKNNFTEYQSERSEVFLRLNLNTQNKQIFATDGLSLDLSAKYMFNNLIRQSANEGMPADFFGSDKSYGGADFSMSHYVSLSEQICFNSSVRARYYTGGAFLDTYKVGGPKQSKSYTYGFVGLEESALLLGNHISVGAALRFHLRSKLYLSPVVKLVHGEQYDFGVRKNITVIGAGLNLDYDSPIGPVSMDIGFANHLDNVVINLGLGYRHIF